MSLIDNGELKMENGWVETTLGAVLEIKYGKDHKKLADGEYPLYGSGGIMRRVESYLYIKPSIMIPRKGSLDNLFYQDKPFWTVDTLFWTKINADIIDPKYLYYLLSLYKLSKYDEGSAVPSLTVKTLNEVPISFPKDKNIQVERREIIEVLDQKIALLKKQNQTLEELAQTLFKRWFVDFEFPNEQGKSYKSSGGKMIASELGEIPEGWSVGSLSSIANYLNGLACQKYPVENENEKLPVLKIKELGNGISINSDWVTSKIDKKYIIQNGDIIFSWSGTLMIKIWNGGKCALNQHLFKVTSIKYPEWFIYQWTNLHLNQFIAIAKSKATTMGHIKRTHLDEAMCFIPQKEVIEKFNSVFDETLKSFKNNSKEIQSLTQLRDTLLPKLMSGSLEIKKEKVSHV